MFFYQAYGLNIHSEFPLPELIEGGEKQDIYIQKGKVKPPELKPTSIKRQGIEALYGGTTQAAYLRWQGIGNFLAKDGSNLIVDPDADNIEPQLLNLYIVSEALGLILYQKGLFLLHASAVKIGEEVVIFAGPPGAGKSTIAATFARCGYTVLADDLVAIAPDYQDKTVVFPAFPQIKIWPKTVKALGYDQSTLPTLFPGSSKRVIIQKENFPVKALPLTSIFILKEGEKLNISKMMGMEAFFSLARFFPCPSAMLEGVYLNQHFEQCDDLLKNVAIWQLENPKNFQTLKNLITLVHQTNSNNLL
ncbi:MAG: hypothetical protein DSM107014_15995 [Gomphosphaeria aponina SAG 52.96 = DSM 107014]|uniref:Serine kinase n=1 Tax=Gomphosphaeria aponina SAG 52.96 = DSM 107014 TaxID=1521640 RepID=A0A941GS57_9CHRO|nr:hypothetical protein [Gomphosphaeria aponina SAG 52.96 = DSM 107014]